MLTSTFNEKSSGKVYHCINVAPEGDHIRPSIGYGAVISPSLRQALNINPDEKIPLVFAATHMSKSLAFSFQHHSNKPHSGEILLNSSLEGRADEFVVICDRKNTMSRERDITVYEISDKNFVKLDNADEQSVSKDAIKFTDAKIVFKAKNAHDLMAKGLQILAFEESKDELKASGFYDKFYKGLRGGKFYSYLGELVNSGKLTWENKEARLKPNIHLAKALNVTLKLPKNLSQKKFAK